MMSISKALRQTRPWRSIARCRSLSAGAPPPPADFVAALAPSLIAHMRDTGARKPVVNFESPEGLHAIFKEIGVPLPLAEGEDAHGHDELLAACSAVLDYSVNTTSPYFNNQLYGTADPVGIAGDWITAVLNANSHTFEVAPVFTIMENELLAKMGRVIGGDFAERYEGLFVPGGALSNLYAITLARQRMAPEVKTEGNYAAPGLTAFTSAEAHYSYKKACSLLGLGSDNLIAVPTGKTGNMDPAALAEALEATVAEGKRPFFVGATAGSTVLGAFDPLEELADVLEAHHAKHALAPDQQVWLHVDGAWGGPAILSPKTRSLVAGAERADSFCWNPHKVLGAPLQCASFISKHPGLLKAANGTNAAYLFQPDKEFTQMDQGDKTFQCGRKVDALKLWLMWKALGDAGMAARVDKLVGAAEYMSSRLGDYRDAEGRRCFVQLFPTSFTNVVFYLIPPSQRGKYDDATLANPTVDSLDLPALAPVAVTVKARMQQAGKAMIGFQPVKGFPNCWRMVFAGAKEDAMTNAVVDTILDDLVAHAEDL